MFGEERLAFGGVDGAGAVAGGLGGGPSGYIDADDRHHTASRDLLRTRPGRGVTRNPHTH